MHSFMSFIVYFLLFFALQLTATGQKNKGKKGAAVSKVDTIASGLNDRKFWLTQMDKMVRPVIYNLANDSLRANMPQVVSISSDNPESRKRVAYLEIFSRTLCGIAPWLHLEGGSPEEISLRNQYRNWVIKAVTNALDSSSKDFMRFDVAGQQLVDASFLAFGFIRSPWLWEHIGSTNKRLFIESLKATRRFRPGFSNWLLFSALNEVFFLQYGYDWDPMRVDFAIRQLEQWYVGDGMYADGPSFAFDYYNSYVIHPYLATIIEVINKKVGTYNAMSEKLKARNERYAVIQERLINSDGTFPATGRSIIYRGAAFHHLADMAWRKKLPPELMPAQVRCALTAVIRKTLESATTYNNGWLTIGLYGSQPNIADAYNNQGSPYLCTTIFLPLGLPDTDEFWSGPPTQWSAQKIWSGKDFPNDHSRDLR
ncbi:MAG TPA: DUF2264 domain-containing protein [Chitinophagaceae bacterium]|nr:DUF2264 domain-containing protein [Chitinophagaceae bacterium]